MNNIRTIGGYEHPFADSSEPSVPRPYQEHITADMRLQPPAFAQILAYGSDFFYPQNVIGNCGAFTDFCKDLLTCLRLIVIMEKKLKPEPEAVYKINIWFYKFTDLIWNPRRHLKKIPLKEGMVVVDYGCGPCRYTLPVAKLVGSKGKVFAVDIQPLAIKTVKEKAARQLFHEIHRLLKQDGFLFMDPGHLKMSKAREIVESTGFFTIVECRDHDMLVAPKDKR